MADNPSYRLLELAGRAPAEAAFWWSGQMAPVADVYERRAESEDSLMAVNPFNGAILDARAGRPFR